jgi:hypothetical protein
LYPGQPRRVTERPTTDRLLKAFKQIFLVVITRDHVTHIHLTPLSKLHTTSLQAMGCPPDLYSRLGMPSQQPPEI